MRLAARDEVVHHWPANTPPQARRELGLGTAKNPLLIGALALVRDFLGPRAEPPTVEVSIGAVLAVVAEHYAVKPAEIQGKRRHRSVTVPRHVCIYLARSHTRFSLEEIGGHFGGRDHSTVLHAIKLVDKRRKSDAEFDRIVDGFSKKLAGETRA